MYWSSGDEDATITAHELPLLRPALPARCHVAAIVPGYPAITTLSSEPTQIPTPRALVKTTPRIRPSRIPRSISRRSFGKYPPRYPQIVSAFPGGCEFACCRYVSSTSVCSRELENTIVCISCFKNSCATCAVSLIELLRIP